MQISQLLSCYVKTSVLAQFLYIFTLMMFYLSFYIYIYIYIYICAYFYSFICCNTTYISFDYDVLLEFFTHLDCVQPNSRGQDISCTLYQGLSPSLGIVSISYGHVHTPRDFRSSFCFTHSVCCI